MLKTQHIFPRNSDFFGLSNEKIKDFIFSKSRKTITPWSTEVPNFESHNPTEPATRHELYRPIVAACDHIHDDTKKKWAINSALNLRISWWMCPFFLWTSPFLMVTNSTNSYGYPPNSAHILSTLVPLVFYTLFGVINLGSTWICLKIWSQHLMINHHIYPAEMAVGLHLMILRHTNKLLGGYPGDPKLEISIRGFLPFIFTGHTAYPIYRWVKTDPTLHYTPQVPT